MQDVTSFVKAQSPLSLAVSGTETKKGSSTGETKTLFSLLLAGLSSSKAGHEIDLNAPLQEQNTAIPKEKTKSLKFNDDKVKSVDEHLLDDMLKLIESLKTNTSMPLFATLKSSPQLEKIINNQTALKEFTEVKTLNDLLSLSKKYSLGLEKITFSKESLDSLQKEFPTLAKSTFFETLRKTEKTEVASLAKEEKLLSTSPSISPVERVLKKSDTIETPSALKTFMAQEQPPKTALKLDKPSETILEKTTVPTEKEIRKEVQISETIGKENKKIASSPAEMLIQKTVAPLQDEVKADKKVKTELTSNTLISKTEHEELLSKSAPTTRTAELKVELPSSKSLTESILQSIKVEKPITEKPFLDKTIITESEKQIASFATPENLSTNTAEEPTLIHTETKSIVKQEPLLKQTITPKESLGQFANDLKEKIEAYKPPIMKVELSLFPKSLGEVDVTLLTRGNNLHVNITSNTSTMTLFSQNQAEFKHALINMGFHNLEMNFSDQNNKEHQHKQSKNNTQHFEDVGEEAFNETITTVQLVVPRYV